MKYLTPEIEALSKNLSTKSLVRPVISCGIFQDCNYNVEQSNLLYQQKTEK